MSHIDISNIKVGDKLVFLGILETYGDPLITNKHSGKTGVVLNINLKYIFPITLNIEGKIFHLHLDEVGFVKTKPLGEWL